MKSAGIFLFLFCFSGCALGLGAGVNVTLDTRGIWTVMGTVTVNNLGVRIEPKETPREEQAIYLMGLEVSSGVALNPMAFVFRMDIPGMGWSMDDLDGGWGANAFVSFRNEVTVPFGDGKTTSAMGASLRGTWMHHLSLEQLERVQGRPEWPDGWRIHRLGPGFSTAIMYDDQDGVYGQFTLGLAYEYLNYFYIGL